MIGVRACSRKLVCFPATIAILFAGVSLAGGEKDVDISSASPLRGNRALIQKGCITCHSIWGVGGKLGPELGSAGQDQPFQQLASMFWNHTPRMVQLLKKKGISWPTLSEQEMADIISFIYYLKLLDQPGDVAVGRSLFRRKKCNICHSLEVTQQGAGPPPLGRFGSYLSPVALAQAMWNTGRSMLDAQESEGIAMPLFQGREMADIQAYIRSKRKTSETVYLPLPDLSRGKSLFQSKGCAHCHFSRRGYPDLSKAPLRKSISEICGILWNHSFHMQQKMAAEGIRFPHMEKNDLSDILAFIYFLHFSRDQGDAERGREIFQGKGCANCHALDVAQESLGPSLAGASENYKMLRLATAMWNHAPIMYEKMESNVMRWIKLEPDDMQHLSKFLRSPKKN